MPSAPAIEQVSPYKGQGSVPGDAPIAVTFDRAMDRGSVESRFEVRPGIDGCDRSACPLSWNANSVTMTHPGHPFANDTRYRVFIHPGYKDSSGQINTVEHVWEFHIETSPQLGSATPSSGSTGVATDTDIVLHFTRAIQPPSPDLMTLHATGAVTEPTVDYHLIADPNDNSIVTVAPLRPLRPNTSYRLTITDQVEDIHHNRLGKRTDVDFTTGQLGLTRSLGFAVRDSQGNATRIAMLRPPASLNARAPSLRTLYQAAQPIRSWGWSFDATRIYTLEADGAVMSVNLATGESARVPVTAASLAVSPTSDELAYVAPDQHLHIWSAAVGDIGVPQVGALQAPPSWSGDGHRLAAVVDAGGRPALIIVDRSTLSRFVVPDVQVAGGSPLSWSFDGANLAFLRDPGGGRPAEVWIYRALSTDSPLLQRIDALPAGTLAWASDGNTLYASVAPTSADKRPLQRAPARPLTGQSGGFSPVRNTQDRDDSPATPSFDRRIAFVRDINGQLQLWLINNDGSGLTQLTFSNYDPPDQLVTFGVASPQWAPGGPGG